MYPIIEGLDFIAIDFETATSCRSSICEAGICLVRSGQIRETRSWLVQPEGNKYACWNIQVHGIHPEDTAHSPAFPEVWDEILDYLDEVPVLVAHNASFDISCLRRSLIYYGLATPDVDYYCSLRAARSLYNFPSNRLGDLCTQFCIPEGTHHRAGDDAEMCARLFLREIKDAGWCTLEDMKCFGGKL